MSFVVRVARSRRWARALSVAAGTALNGAARRQTRTRERRGSGAAAATPNAAARGQARIREQLRTAGLKATPQRLKVLQTMLVHERRHLCAEDVYLRISQQNGHVGMATIYRVLGQLTEAGILARHIFDAESGKSVYEVQQDVHHDHLICVRCGKVDEFIDDDIAARSRSLAASAGYTFAQHQLALYGYCSACSTAARSGRQRATPAAVERTTEVPY
jgi:Fur family ferric uptake transcriptional regulator